MRKFATFRSNIHKAAKLKRLFNLSFLLLPGFLPAFSSDQANLDGWQNTIDREIVSTTQFPLYALPDLGLLVYHDLRFDQQVTLLDPLQHQIRRIGRKGPGPEEFGFYLRLGSDTEGHLFGFDRKKGFIHLYDIASGMVIQVINQRPWWQKYSTTYTVIGKSGNKWLVKWPEQLKDAYVSKANVQKQLDHNTLVYGYAGDKEGTVEEKLKIKNPNGLFLHSILMIAEKLIHLGDHDVLAIRNPFEFSRKQMTIRIVNLPDWTERKVHFNIPKHFSRVGHDYYEQLKSMNVGFYFTGPDDHNPQPTHAGIGLDNRIYYIFVADEKDGRVETMINILDPATLKTEQYVYEGTVIPYVFAKDMVYCSDLAEDAIRVLPVSDVLNEKNRYQPE